MRASWTLAKANFFSPCPVAMHKITKTFPLARATFAGGSAVCRLTLVELAACRFYARTRVISFAHGLQRILSYRWDHRDIKVFDFAVAGGAYEVRHP